jgi:hypothetical protein
MKKVNNKKKSPMRKLIPAAGSLAISAAMLSTSTYAWFTMSKEVEVTGIQMTATVPENLEISLGDNTGIVVPGSLGLNTATGVTITNAGKVPYDGIMAPDGATNGSDDVATIKNTTDWSNSVDFSKHYVAGKLKPVSSTDGNFLFKTADANEKGKAVERTAGFTAVTREDEAGLYRIGSVEGDKFTYNGNANTSYLDSANLVEGYYVDFPVWFRTSAKGSASVNHSTGYITEANLNLGVVASIKQRTTTTADEDLYHAVRVAIIPSGNTASADGTMVTTGSPGTIVNTINDSQDPTVAWYNRYGSDKTGNGKTSDAAVDLKDVTRQAVKAPGNLIWNPSTALATNANEIYGWADLVNQAYTADTGESVVKVPLAAANADWGYSDRYIIRVWLEGEDVNCWNETAGQDWDITLKFVQLESTASGDTDTSDTSHAAPTANALGLGNASTSTAVGAVSNSTISFTVTGGDMNGQTIAYTKNGSTWSTTSTALDYTTSGDTKTYNKTTYKLADGTTFSNMSGLTAYVNEYADKYDFSGATLTAVGS